MHAVFLGEPSTCPLLPGYVASVFSFKKTAEKRPHTQFMMVKNCSKLRFTHFAPISRVTTMKGTTKQGKGLLERTSTNVVATQTSRRERRVQQDEDKILVIERECMQGD